MMTTEYSPGSMGEDPPAVRAVSFLPSIRQIPVQSFCVGFAGSRGFHMG
jgi:hypothetical protein